MSTTQNHSTFKAASGEYVAGARSVAPLILGAAPFGIIFGAVCAATGLSTIMALAMSGIVFAGSAQFIAVGLLSQGAAPEMIVLTTLLVNFRHVLYAASLAPYMRHLPQRWLLPLGFLLTDEAYAAVINCYTDHNSPPSPWRHFGSAFSFYLAWVFFTWMGITAGTQLKGITKLGLDFAMIVTFLGIIVPQISTRPRLVCAIVSGFTAVYANGLPNQSGLIVAAVLGIISGTFVESCTQQKKGNT